MQSILWIFRLFLPIIHTMEMKRTFLFFLISLIGFTAFSQRVYFVYLQTEQSQPFFVKMKNKVFTSETSGYLILSNLYDSTYSFSIGFPHNKWPEQNFSVKIDAKDHGFLVKDFGDKGWGLFDLQTLTVQMPLVNSKQDSFVTQEHVSPFSEILAKATGDSTLLLKPVVPKESKEIVVKTEMPAEAKKDTIITTHQIPGIIQANIESKKEDIVREESKPVASAPYKRSTVTRRSESSTTAGFTISYIDDFGTGRDTIKITIPEPAETKKTGDAGKKESIKFLDMNVDSSGAPGKVEFANEQNNKINETQNDSTGALSNSGGIKKDCRAFAEEKDFFELRKNMAASNGNDKMIEAAKKYFRTKCFLTAQLKNLSALFLDDAGKYNFFDAAYNHVSDLENFSTLQSELKDQYYINRFKAMLRN